jgi:hypothetical protein
VHQAKYTKDLIKKFNMAELKPVSTPMSSTASLDPDEDGEAMDQREYMSMIGSPCTLQRHDQTFSSSWGCARAFRLPHALRIGQQFSEFSGISNTPLSLGFGILLLLHWMDLVGFSDADFAGCGIDQKSTSGTCHLLGSSLVCWSSQK